MSETGTFNNFMRVEGGLCFAHGPYSGPNCPQWPKCATDPPVDKWVSRAMHQINKTPYDQGFNTQSAYYAFSAALKRVEGKDELRSW